MGIRLSRFSKKNTCSNENCREPADYYCQVCESEGYCNTCYYRHFQELKTWCKIIRSCKICLTNAHTMCMKEREIGNRMEWVCIPCIKENASMWKTDKEGTQQKGPALQKSGEQGNLERLRRGIIAIPQWCAG